jgi:hypothetical protein
MVEGGEEGGVAEARGKPIQGSLHCASQKQERDAPVEMTGRWGDAREERVARGRNKGQGTEQRAEDGTKGRARNKGQGTEKKQGTKKKQIPAG